MSLTKTELLSAIQVRAEEIKGTLAEIGAEELHQEVVELKRKNPGISNNAYTQTRTTNLEQTLEARARVSAIISTLNDRQEEAFAAYNQATPDISTASYSELNARLRSIKVEPEQVWRNAADVQFKIYNPRDYQDAAMATLLAREVDKILKADYQQGYAQALEEMKVEGESSLPLSGRLLKKATDLNEGRYGTDAPLIGYGHGYYDAYQPVLKELDAERERAQFEQKVDEIKQHAEPLLQAMRDAGVPAEIVAKVGERLSIRNCKVERGKLELLSFNPEFVLRPAGRQYVDTVANILLENGALDAEQMIHVPHIRFGQSVRPVEPAVPVGMTKKALSTSVVLPPEVGISEATLHGPSSVVARILAQGRSHDEQFALPHDKRGPHHDDGTGWNRHRFNTSFGDEDFGR